MTPGKVDQRRFRPQLELLEARCLLSITPLILGRELFYNHSLFDGNNAAITPADEAAIATDKTAYLPGAGTASLASVSSYRYGINGLMIEIAGSHPQLTVDDFQFRTGNDNSPATWDAAPAPSAFSVFPLTSGSDRVEIVWPDGAIVNRWLEVIVAANEHTGLATSDVFYFGSRVGDTFLFSPPNAAVTNATDEIQARANGAAGVGITNPYDFDRNGLVNATDQIIARANGGITPRIDIALAPPTLDASLVNDTAPGGGQNTDGVTSDPTVEAIVSAPEGIASFTAASTAAPTSTYSPT